MVGGGHSTAHRARRQIVEEMRQKHEGGRTLPPFGSHIRIFARRSQSEHFSLNQLSPQCSADVAYR